MQLIKIKDIIIPENRQRKNFPPARQDELRQSIQSKGLMHPIVLQNDGKTLSAGERRLRVISSLLELDVHIECNGQEVPLGFIPYTLLKDLPPELLIEAELEENLVRLDLTWQERDKAIADLHQFRSAQQARKGSVQTITATATEVFSETVNPAQVTLTQETIIVAQHLDNPEVAKAKSHKEAVKIIKKLKQSEHRAHLAGKIDLTKVRHDIRNADMRTEMLTLPADTYKVIITDPPYGVGADAFGSMSGTGHNYQDSWEYAEEIYRVLAEEGFRACKKEAHLYAFCDISHFREIALMFSLAGWSVWSRPLIWSKGNGMLPRPEHGPRNSYECILFASKGDMKTQCVKNDVLTITADQNIMHGAQKPVDLYIDLLSRSALPGDQILDPCAGSGPVIPAAEKMHCTATAFEAFEANYHMVLSRLETKPSDNLDLNLEL